MLPTILMIIPFVLAGIAFCFLIGARSAVLQTRQSGNATGLQEVVLLFTGLGIGGLLMFIGHMGVIVNASRESIATGLVAFVFGVYAVWFALTRWEQNRHFVVMYVLGIVVILGGVAIVPRQKHQPVIRSGSRVETYQPTSGDVNPRAPIMLGHVANLR